MPMEPMWPTLPETPVRIGPLQGNPKEVLSRPTAGESGAAGAARALLAAGRHASVRRQSFIEVGAARCGASSAIPSDCQNAGLPDIALRVVIG